MHLAKRAISASGVTVRRSKSNTLYWDTVGRGGVSGSPMTALKQAFAAMKNLLADLERAGDIAGASRLLQQLKGVRAIKLLAQD